MNSLSLRPLSFDKKSKSLNKILIKALKTPEILNSPIKQLFRNSRHNDEPFVHQYSASYTERSGQKGLSSGLSFNKEKAKVKALCEAVERYALGNYDESKLLCTTTIETANQFLSPNSVVSFSSDQNLPRQFGINEHDRKQKIRWSRGFSLPTYSKIYIPAQLVYVPYSYGKSESIIRLPISTGAACGQTVDEAIYRGICEVIERDAFMISYLNKVEAPRIKVEKSSGKYQDTYLYLKRYQLNWFVFDITTNIGVPVLMSIILDHSGVGPAISIGLKCSLFLDEAILGSLEESLQTRSWMRDEFSETTNKELRNIKKQPNKITDARERGLFWYDGDQEGALDFWIKSGITKELGEFNRPNEFVNKNYVVLIKKLLSKLDKLGYQTYFCDITPKIFSTSEFRVAKVIIPQLQPFYLDERYKYLGGTRLNKDNKQELNNVPHPFL